MFDAMVYTAEHGFADKIGNELATNGRDNLLYIQSYLSYIWSLLMTEDVIDKKQVKKLYVLAELLLEKHEEVLGELEDAVGTSPLKEFIEDLVDSKLICALEQLRGFGYDLHEHGKDNNGAGKSFKREKVRRVADRDFVEELDIMIESFTSEYERIMGDAQMLRYRED